jgi:hypothetical protein
MTMLRSSLSTLVYGENGPIEGYQYEQARLMTAAAIAAIQVRLQ